MSNLLESLLGQAGKTLDQVLGGLGELADPTKLGEIGRAFGEQVRGRLDELATLMRKPRPLVFGTPGYEKLAADVVAASGGKLELGKDERKNFKDGRPWHHFTQSIEGRHVIVIGGWLTDTELMNLYRTGYNAWQWKADRLTMVIPYHGDARQERAQIDGESIDGLYTSMMLAAIPKCPNRNDVVLVDIHTDTVTGFFQAAGMRATNLEALAPLMDKVRNERYGGKCALASPDAGRGKIVQKKADALELTAVIASKLRSGNKTKTDGILGNPAGQNVLLSDDMGVSFGSAIAAGGIIKKAEALEQVLVLAHAVVPNNPETGLPFIKELVDSGLFAALYVTDSLPRAHEIKAMYPDFVHVEPLAPILAEHLIKHSAS